MPQALLSCQYLDAPSSGMTALAGLPVYLYLARVTGLSDMVRGHLRIRPEDGQGWIDSQIIRSLILLKLARGDYASDINLLEADEGLCWVMRKAEGHGLSRKERRDRERRFRKGAKRSFSSESSIFRYKGFHAYQPLTTY